MKNHMRKRAFSLIELLVVVAIIALLSAIAIPTYRQYQVKVAVNNVYALLQQTAANAVMTYQKTGALPNTITFSNNVTYSPGVGWYNAPSTGLPYAIQNSSFTVYNFLFTNSTLNGGSDNKGFAVGATIAGLTGYVSGYTEPANAGGPGNTAQNTIYWAVRDVNGTMQYACGSWGGVTTQIIPAAYQPSNCTCQQVDKFMKQGVCT